MEIIVLTVIAFFLMGLSDFPPIVHNKKWYELMVLSVLYAGVFVLAVLYISGVPLPSPVKGIQFLIRDVLKLGYPLE